MCKIRTWLALVLIYSAYLNAEFNQPMCNLDISGGYRHDNVEWAFAGGSHSPSELWRMKFNDLQLWEIAANYSYTTCNNYYIRLNGDYGRILSGHCRAIGWARDNKHAEFSSIKGKANKGHVYDVTGGIGYTFTSNGHRFIGTPVLGYSWRYQFLNMFDADQVVNLPRALLGIYEDADLSRVHSRGKLGHINGLKVNYNPRWFGPFLGFDWMVIVEPCFLVFGRVEWYFAEQFRANGKWNHRDRYLLDFSHHAAGSGLVLNLGGNYRLGNGWFIGVEGEYRNFQTGTGRHTVNKFKDSNKNKDIIFGKMPNTASREEETHSVRLNRAAWNSYCIEISIAYRYWCDT